MTALRNGTSAFTRSSIARSPTAMVVAVCLASWGVILGSPEDPKTGDDQRERACEVLADRRVEEPLTTIASEYDRLEASRISLRFLSRSEVDALVKGKKAGCDVVVGMPADVNGKTAVDSLPGATKVAWKHPSREPVWAAVLGKHSKAEGFVRFMGGPTGHRLWSESRAGFTIVPGTSSEAYEWVAENRTKHTYPLTAMRMLAECGGIRDGICIDLGCGPGHLELELAKRSNFKIVGMDIDPGARPLFEKRIRDAGLEDRVSFVLGDAQKMPFPDDYADVVFSRGTLIFIPDIAKCLREVERVMKPSGVAFLGGRYIYAPQSDKMSTARLREIVRESGVAGARVVDARGQWVKIVGPEAPEAARHSQGGPHMLANRFIADYGITKGKGLLICGADGDPQRALQQGFVDSTDLQITALYPSEKLVGEAEERIEGANLTERIACKVGKLGALPFEDATFDLIAGVGPILVFEKDKENAMREIYRVLRPGGVALVGGRYLGMPARMKVSSESLRRVAARTGISSIRVHDEMGQWVEIRKGVRDRG